LFILLRQTQGLLCQLKLYGVFYEKTIFSRKVQQEPDSFIVCHPLDDNDRVSELMYKIDLSESVLAEVRPRLKQSEQVHVQITDAIVQHDVVVMQKTSTVQVLAATGRRQLKPPALTGDLTALMLRVVATDSEPDDSEELLHQLTFGTSISLASQLFDCSAGKFRLSPTEHGVLTVNVDIAAYGSSRELLANAALEAAGVLLGLDIYYAADFLMIVLPPGTGDWAAFGVIPGKQTVYNNQWGGFLGGTAHELGHNLGLMHAYDNGVEYGGNTGK
jgi:hypothetical protein